MFIHILFVDRHIVLEYWKFFFNTLNKLNENKKKTNNHTELFFCFALFEKKFMKQLIVNWVFFFFFSFENRISSLVNFSRICFLPIITTSADSGRFTIAGIFSFVVDFFLLRRNFFSIRSLHLLNCIMREFN